MMAEKKRIFLLGGHYGSGKTEFCINYSLLLAKEGHKVALIDLDIVNPYFRSREKAKFLEKQGISVYGSAFDSEITMEIPALSARVRAPLEDPSTFSVIDLGGNDSGALIVVQFQKYLSRENSEFWAVVNSLRPETSTVQRALNQLHAIEKRIKLKFTGLINNTNLLKETTLSDLEFGLEFSSQMSDKMGLPVQFTCCPASLMSELNSSPLKEKIQHPIIPLQLIMRNSWLDKKV